MIDIIEKRLCCGCAACVQKCPKSCIDMFEDEEGFLYPQVDKSSCINCHLCEHVCPVINQRNPRHPEICKAIKAKDEKLRQNSSSGGVFSLIAERILCEGGVIFGACFNEKWEVVHGWTENVSDYHKFRGSKYVQSRIGNAYKQAELFLKEGRKVLFSGTPCQISALKLFLGREYTNLYLMDFVCHGVPSPGIFRWYLQEKVNKYAPKTGKNTVSFLPINSIPQGDVLVPSTMRIEDIHFRDKRNGWKKYSFVFTFTKPLGDGKQNSVSFSSNVCENAYLQGFIGDLFLRPSCHDCPCRHLKSGSDVMVGDFWGQEYTFPNFDKDTGVSAIFPLTPKGFKLMQEIEPEAQIVERPFCDFLKYNPAIFSSKSIPDVRGKFWSLPYKYSLEERIRKAYQAPLRERILYRLKRFFYHWK